MAILDRFRKKSADINSAQLPLMGRQELNGFMFKLGAMDPAKIWATQPNVRAAVDFIAMQVSHLGLHTFERGPDDGRERNRESVIANTLAHPNPEHTSTELIRALVSDTTLYDEAWWFITPQASGKWEIRPLPVDSIVIKSGAEIDGTLVVTYQGLTGTIDIPQANLLHFKGWTPSYSANGKSVVDTLKDLLAEQIAAAAYRRAMWNRGGQMGAYITRPAAAPPWSETARTRFDEGLKAYKAGQAKAGGILLLEDGMEIAQNRFSAKEEQYFEAQQLSFEIVARAFHLHPSMLGATGGISYANVKEFRKMLYGETLGPRLKVIEDRINSKLIPLTDPNKDLYVEFNTKAKMAGSPDEQADYNSKSTGRPWKTVNEVRKQENLPPLEGGDELTTPLNVAVGGQASPADTQPKAAGTPQRKAAAPKEAQGAADDASAGAVALTLEKFFKRQASSVLAKVNSKAAGDWFDTERWNKELAEDLFAVAQLVTGQVSADLLDTLGEAPDAYNAEQTLAFLKAVAESRAGWINAATQEAIQAVLDDPGEGEDGKPARTPETVFEEVKTSRSDQIAGTLLTTLVAFAAVETAKQAGGSKATKTWLVTSDNPRSTHSRMRNETVPVDKKFSNRANWPGDPVLGADGVAHCKCEVRITIP